MNIRKTQTHEHNNTVFVLDYAPSNQAWFVWRLDNGHQTGLRLHSDFASALTDYRDRVGFYREVVGLPELDYDL